MTCNKTQADPFICPACGSRLERAETHRRRRSPPRGPGEPPLGADMEWGEGGPGAGIVETLKCPDCGFEGG
jgi:predicted RNA-binding Zn-ribbon protein involved in translation (DUF1610 family)